MTLKEVVEIFGGEKIVTVLETQYGGFVDYSICQSLLQHKKTPYPFKCTIMPAKDVPNAVNKLISVLEDKHND